MIWAARCKPCPKLPPQVAANGLAFRLLRWGNDLTASGLAGTPRTILYDDQGNYGRVGFHAAVTKATGQQSLAAVATRRYPLRDHVIILLSIAVRVRRHIFIHMPFFDSARKLLEVGAGPNDLLVMRHQGSGTTSLRARIGAAAKLAIHETNAGPRHTPWRDLSQIWNAESEVDC